MEPRQRLKRHLHSIGQRDLRVPYHREHHIERREILISRAGGDHGVPESRLFVRRALLTTSAALSGSGSSHCYFFAILCLRAWHHICLFFPSFPSSYLRPITNSLSRIFVFVAA